MAGAVFISLAEPQLMPKVYGQRKKKKKEKPILLMYIVQHRATALFDDNSPSSGVPFPLQLHLQLQPHSLALTPHLSAATYC